jgi:hypothetical protein
VQLKRKVWVSFHDYTESDECPLDGPFPFLLIDL